MRTIGDRLEARRTSAPETLAERVLSPYKLRSAFHTMNIHEYQARELFGKFGVATQPGRVASTAEEAEKIAAELGDARLVVKAQIHAGGRGKGTFKNGFKGGVHRRDIADGGRDIAGKMLGQTLVTHQTGAEGKLVEQGLRRRGGGHREGTLLRHPPRPRHERLHHHRQHRGRREHRGSRRAHAGEDHQGAHSPHARACRPIRAGRSPPRSASRGPLMNQAVKLFTAPLQPLPRSATARWWRSTRWSSPTDGRLWRWMRSSTSTTTRSTGTRRSSRCATCPRKTRAKSPPASST